MLRRIYDWIIALSASRHALPALAAIAFAESSFFPIPPDAFVIPMVLAQPQRAWRIALVATSASVLGGIAGYAIGMYLQGFSQWLIGAQNFEAFRAAYAQWGLWIILIKGLTPIPYKLVTIASGFAGYNLFLFVVLSAITRGLRFGIVAGLIAYFGEPIRNFIEKRLEYVMIGVLVLVVAGFLVARYIV